MQNTGKFNKPLDIKTPQKHQFNKKKKPSEQKRMTTKISKTSHNKLKETMGNDRERSLTGEIDRAVDVYYLLCSIAGNDVSDRLNEIEKVLKQHLK